MHNYSPNLKNSFLKYLTCFHYIGYISSLWLQWFSQETPTWTKLINSNKISLNIELNRI